eukprot:COSAG01_NODE_43583_length_428_cov_0.948328_1_plen_59_part_10
MPGPVEVFEPGVVVTDPIVRGVVVDRGVGTSDGGSGDGPNKDSSDVDFGDATRPTAWQA